MVSIALTELQCLYGTAKSLLPIWAERFYRASNPVECKYISTLLIDLQTLECLSDCTAQLKFYKPSEPYGI